MDNGISIGLKIKNGVTGEKKLEKYVETLSKIYTLLNSIDKGSLSNLNGVVSAIKTQNNETKNLTKNNTDLAKSMKLAFDTQNIKTFLSVFKKVVSSITKITEKTADYLENLNLIDVAYKNDTNQASRLVNTLSEMYGLDESWGYRQVGIFKQLANAMGLSDEVGTKLAKTLTQLAIDTSSLYNFGVDEASQILQSGLAGQTKPVRRLGGDITQSTLQLVLEEHGIDKAIGDLNYVEKRLVIVTALLDQTKEAHGDWGRTIESVSNQMRIFQQQTERLGRAIGSVFLPMVKAVLPYLNAIMMVLTELIEMLAKLVGYNEDDFNFFGEEDLSGLLDNVDGVGTGLEKANKEAKKLNTSLRSFDKLNNITTPTDSKDKNSGGSGTSIGADILDMFNKASDSYLNNLDKIQMKATKIRDAIMEWLGFEKQIDPLTGDVYFKFKKLTSGSVLGALAVGGIIYLGLSKVVKLIGTILASKTGWSVLKDNVGAVTAGILGLVAGLALVKKGFEDTGKEGSNWYLETVAGNLTMEGSFAAVGAKIGGVKGALIGLGIGAAVAWVSNVVQGINSIKKAYEATSKGGQKAIDELKEAQKSLQDDLANYSLNLDSGLKLIDMLKEITDENGKVVEGYETRAQNIIDALNDTYGTEYELKGNVIILNGKEQKSIDGIKESLEDLIVKKKAEYILEAYKDKYIENLKKRQELQEDLNKRLHTYNTMYELYKKDPEEAAKRYDLSTKEIEKSLDRQRQGIKNVEEAILDYDDDIKNYDDLLEASLDGNVEKLEKNLENYGVTTKKSVEKSAKETSTAFTNKFKDMKKAFDNTLSNLGIKINTSVETNDAQKELTEFIKKFNSSQSLIKLPIPKFANGGLPPVGQLFIANEKGPELVGSLGGQTFVANQKQVLDMIGRNMNTSQPVNATFVVKVGDKEVARQVINDLQSMAKNNGKPITIS